MESNPATSAPLAILVVDDDRDTAESQAHVLNLYGFKARFALTAEDALREVAADAPDVVLLDIRLGNRNGWELARAVKSLSKTTSVFSVTGCNEPDDYRRSGAAGIDLHLVKPVDPAFLVGVLRGIATSRMGPRPVEAP